jgi:hypothetical protein
MGLFDFFQDKDEQPSEPNFKEKRLLPRWKISAPAKIKWQGAADYTPCEIRDLNLRGFSLVLAEKIQEANTRAEIYFNDKYFFDIGFCITWHKEAEGKQVYGIKFVTVRDLDKEKIYLMMQDIFPNSFGKSL